MSPQYIIALAVRCQGVSYITSPRFHTTRRTTKALRFTSEHQAEQFMRRWYAHLDSEDYDILEYAEPRQVKAK
jgi:hypothetical protein